MPGAQAKKLQVFTISGPGITTDAICPVAFDNCYILNLGTVDAIGLTTSTFTKLSSTAPLGELFSCASTINVRAGATYNNQAMTLTATVLTDFAHNTVLQPAACTAACGSSAGFTILTTTPTNILNGAEGPAVPVDLAARVREINGASAFNTADSVVFQVQASGAGANSFDRLTINVTQVNTAILVNFSPFAVGSTTDYATSFGSVNGLGLGGTTAPSATPKGVIYYANYSLTPRFANFSNTAATLKAYVSTDFSPANAASTLTLCDASVSLGACTALSKSSLSPTTISAGLSDNAAFNRFLGLIVAENNTATAFPGSGGAGSSTNATITFLFSVP